MRNYCIVAGCYEPLTIDDTFCNAHIKRKQIRRYEKIRCDHCNNMSHKRKMIWRLLPTTMLYFCSKKCYNKYNATHKVKIQTLKDARSIESLDFALNLINIQDPNALSIDFILNLMGDL